jgi:hypothetical protein
LLVYLIALILRRNVYYVPSVIPSAIDQDTHVYAHVVGIFTGGYTDFELAKCVRLPGFESDLCDWVGGLYLCLVLSTGFSLVEEHLSRRIDCVSIFPQWLQHFDGCKGAIWAACIREGHRDVPSVGVTAAVSGHYCDFESFTDDGLPLRSNVLYRRRDHLGQRKRGPR